MRNAHKIFFCLGIALSFSFNSYAYLLDEQEWIETANSYEKSLKNYAKSLIFLRDQKLNEEFRKRISNIEFSLKKDTKKTVAFVDEFLKAQEGRVFLDDDLVMRLALLYYKHSNYVLQDQMDEYHSQLSAYYAGRIKKSPSLPSPDYSLTEQYCTRLIQEFPRSEFGDYASYLLGVISEERGDYQVAIRKYKKIIDEYPYSKHRPESLWRSAELNYDFENYKLAEDLYKQVLEIDSEDYTAKAMYKLGALYYNQKRNTEARKIFFGLLETLDKQELTAINLSLKSEVYEYIGLLYVKGLSIDELSEETQRKSLEAVAKRLERHNQFSFARDIYKNYIKKNYFNPQVPAYYSLLIESLESDGKIAESIQYREKFVNHISKNGKWWNKNLDGEARYNAEEALDKTRLEIARYYADQGIQSGKRSDLLKARKSYRRFIATENSGESTATALFELAQIESKLGMYKNAAKNFSSALEKGLVEEDRSLAAYSQFLSIVESRAYKLPKLRASLVAKQPQALSVTEGIIEESYSSLKEEWKNTEYEVPAEYFVAQMYLAKSQLSKAEPILAKLLGRDNLEAKQISYIEDSAKWLVEIYTKEKNWAKVSDVNSRLKNLGAVSSLETSKLAKMRFNNSVLTEAELLEEQGKSLEAASAFLSFATNNPKNYESDRAIFKAAQLLRDEGNYKESNKNLSKIFATEYRKDVLRMYTQNLVDSFRFSEATKFVNSLSKKDHRKDPSLMNVVKLESFLSKEPNIGEKFFGLYLKNKQFAYGAQAFKEFAYSGKLKDSALVLTKMKSNRNKDIGMSALEALQNWFVGNQQAANDICKGYVKGYTKRKKVTSLQQDLQYQCLNILSKFDSSTGTEDLKEEMLADGAKEAYMFSIAEDKTSKLSMLRSLYAEASQQGFAVANLLERKLKEQGAYEFKKHELFPFQIARSEAIAWRKLARKDKVFAIQDFCEKQGYGSCYKGLLKFSKNSENKNLDLKLKISLLLDNDKEAVAYANELLDTVSANERTKYESLFRRMNLGAYKADLKEYLESIFVGNSSLNDYLYLAKYFYQQKNRRAAAFVLSTAQKRFPENPVAQYTVSHLLDKNTDVLSYQVSDPRVWFLQHRLGISKNQNYLSKKKLLGGGEWYYSLALLKAMESEKIKPKIKDRDSAYYLMLASFHKYTKQDWSSAKDFLQQAKALGTMPIVEQDIVMERGIASENE